MRTLLFILVIVAVFSACKKSTVQGDSVEIYLLKKFQPVPGKCQVDAATAVLQDSAIVLDSDIITYSKSDYRFTLKFAAMQKIEALSDGTPFAVTVDKQVIYYGIFKPNFSSSFCDQSITMAVDWLAGNSIVLSLSYPGPSSVTTINDRRNNPKLIAMLQHQGKLH